MWLKILILNSFKHPTYFPSKIVEENNLPGEFLLFSFSSLNRLEGGEKDTEVNCGLLEKQKEGGRTGDRLRESNDRKHGGSTASRLQTGHNKTILCHQHILRKSHQALWNGRHGSIPPGS